MSHVLFVDVCCRFFQEMLYSLHLMNFRKLGQTWQIPKAFLRASGLQGVVFGKSKHAIRRQSRNMANLLMVGVRQRVLDPGVVSVSICTFRICISYIYSSERQTLHMYTQA